MLSKKLMQVGGLNYHAGFNDTIFLQYDAAGSGSVTAVSNSAGGIYFGSGDDSIFLNLSIVSSDYAGPTNSVEYYLNNTDSRMAEAVNDWLNTNGDTVEGGDSLTGKFLMTLDDTSWTLSFGYHNASLSASGAPTDQWDSADDQSTDTLTFTTN